MVTALSHTNCGTNYEIDRVEYWKLYLFDYIFEADLIQLQTTFIERIIAKVIPSLWPSSGL